MQAQKQKSRCSLKPLPELRKQFSDFLCGTPSSCRFAYQLEYYDYHPLSSTRFRAKQGSSRNHTRHYHNAIIQFIFLKTCPEKLPACGSA